MNVDLVLTLAMIAKLRIEALQRRVQGKPGHQGATPNELLTMARADLDKLELELSK